MIIKRAKCECGKEIVDGHCAACDALRKPHTRASQNARRIQERDAAEQRVFRGMREAMKNAKPRGRLLFSNPFADVDYYR